MTTVDPDTLDRDPEVLRDIGRRFGGRIALNAEVAKPGAIAVGDSVRLVPDEETQSWSPRSAPPTTHQSSLQAVPQ